MGYSGGSSDGDIGGSNNSGGYSSADYSYGGYYNSDTGYTNPDYSYGGSYNSGGGK